MRNTELIEKKLSRGETNFAFQMCKTIFRAKKKRKKKKADITSTEVRATAIHPIHLGFDCGFDAICGLSLLVLYSALRGFSGYYDFPSHQNPTFDLTCCA